MSATPSTPEPPAVDRAEALRFLTLLAEDDYQHVTFQTFDDSDAKRGSLARILHAGVRGVYEELVALNADGAGVFVTVNRTDHKGRSAENVVGIRALFVDLDGAPLGPVLAAGLEPHIVVESSPGRFHAYWIMIARSIASQPFRRRWPRSSPATPRYTTSPA